MNVLNALPQPIAGLMPLWLDSQTELRKVTRWAKYLRRNPELRAQTDDVHVFSLSLLAATTLPLIDQLNSMGDGRKLNCSLILSACLAHELGEGVLQSDVHFIDKTRKRDAMEYHAFAKRYQETKFWPWLRDAFLLQFLHDQRDFEFEERQLLAGLNQFQTEAQVFCALECFDYIMYAMECWQDHRDEVITAHVLTNQPPRMDDFVAQVPGLTAIWTEETRDWCREFSKAHAHVIPEKDYPFPPE